MTDRELMQQALDALESSRVFVTSKEKIKHPEGTEWYDSRITALRDRLAQPEQEPVVLMDAPLLLNGQPLYTTPPQRPWVGLTNEDIACMDWESFVTKRDCANAIEARLKEKTHEHLSKLRKDSWYTR